LLVYLTSEWPRGVSGQTDIDRCGACWQSLRPRLSSSPRPHDRLPSRTILARAMPSHGAKVDSFTSATSIVASTNCYSALAAAQSPEASPLDKVQAISGDAAL